MPFWVHLFSHDVADHTTHSGPALAAAPLVVFNNSLHSVTRRYARYNINLAREMVGLSETAENHPSEFWLVHEGAVNFRVRRNR